MATEALRRVCDNELMRMEVISRDKMLYDWDRDLAQIKLEGKEEGIEIGEAIGKAEEKIEIARTLLKLGKLSIEDISSSTGLSIKEIEKINE